MTRRISVRLPDELVAWMDQRVASGPARNRSEVIARMLDRERRRDLSERDIDILIQTGGEPYPDLDGLAEYAARNSPDLD